MKSSDYIIDFLVKKGIRHIFGYQGTMIAHFVDSACKDERIENHSCYNEQGAGFAAVGLAKATGRLAAAYSTSGPGAANLISAVADAYYDSTPVIFFTGQLNSYEYYDIEGLRQNGFQEMNVVSMARDLTKYCVQITDIADLRYCLEKAAYLAESGRPGPVVIDLPMNMQRQEINPEEMRGFEPEPEADIRPEAKLAAEDILSRLDKAERPVLMIGNGIIYGSETHAKILSFAEALDIPVITSMLGRDLMPYDHRLNFGHIGGGYGHRYANIIAHKKTDLIVSIGCSLCKRQTTGKVEKFAEKAQIVRVDIDPVELKRVIHADEVQYCIDCVPVVSCLHDAVSDKNKKHTEWLGICSGIREKLTAFDQSCEEREPNRIIEAVSESIPDDAVICCDVGQHQVWTSQSFCVKEGQQLLFSGGHGAMGFALPAAIGAHFATGTRSVAICGDGAMQMNIQELQWVVREQLPVTIVVLNNRSLGLIRQQQDDMLSSYYAASMPEGGFTSPDFAKVAEAYGMKAVKLTGVDEVRSEMAKLDCSGPVLVEIMVDNYSTAFPKTYFGEEMHNQRPYIPDDLMEEIMRI